jgi:ATP-dependent helicase HrpA
VHKRFIADNEYSQLAHFPRYLKAMNVRLEKLRGNPSRDAQLMAEWQNAASQFQRISKQPGKSNDPRMTEFRWMLEELRVSRCSRRSCARRCRCRPSGCRRCGSR